MFSLNVKSTSANTILQVDKCAFLLLDDKTQQNTNFVIIHDLFYFY